MSAITRTFVGAAAVALTLTAGSASTALASSETSAGQVCVTSGSASQLCVPGTPGYYGARMAITSIHNWSTYAVRVRPAEGININCVSPGGSFTYSQPYQILGIQVLSSSTCVW
ncbi:hypothetical protein [Nonomuraea candida]|uniref:hypothetical protein n=1 Tax=Nonomuraea candida TaxID=359159 RepID=UPI0005BA3E79|nr:hypothetical protein [Nonomuraea candida]